MNEKPNITIDIHDNQKVEVLPSVTSMSVVNNYYGNGKSTSVQTDEFHLTDEQQAIFDRAIAANLMEKTDTGYRWFDSGPSLLAYFLGRVFCGDTVTTNREGKEIWQSGGVPLPAKALEQLFSRTGFANYRTKQLYSGPPIQHHKVDDIVMAEN